MKKNFVEELRWRGLLHDLMPGTEEQLMKEVTSGYIGFDPTSDSLHIGSLVQITLLRHFQLCGHKPIALVGGATGMVGDPSGKSQERNLLDEAQLRHNVNCVKKQLGKFIDFDNGAEVVNNYDWFAPMSALDFLRDVGKHITISYMMAKDSVQKRLETGISFTEFSYQLLQGYDFYWLNQNKGVKLQMGGSDQWGNIVTGTELIRRKAGGEAFALVSPLVTKSDGSKFGKTEKGNVWLNRNKTSPYQFYQFWINASDADAARYMRYFTYRSQEEILELENNHKAAPHERLLQKELAKDLTVLVHSQEDLDFALEATELLFGKNSTLQLGNLSSDQLLTIFEGVPSSIVSQSDFDNGINVLELLVDKAQVFPSRSEAKKMIQSNAVLVNKEKWTDLTGNFEKNHLLQGKFLLVQKGKKNYHLIVVE
jgi:tyrosyl-tRNA synthetase